MLIGSKCFSRNFVDSVYRPIFGVVWDMIGDKDLRLPKEDYSRQGAPEVVDRVSRTAAEFGHDDVFVNEEIGGVTDDHVPLLRAGMRVIDLIDLDYSYHHRPTDTYDKISARSSSIVGEVGRGVASLAAPGVRKALALDVGPGARAVLSQGSRRRRHAGRGSLHPVEA